MGEGDVKDYFQTQSALLGEQREGSEESVWGKRSLLGVGIYLL